MQQHNSSGHSPAAAIEAGVRQRFLGQAQRSLIL